MTGPDFDQPRGYRTAIPPQPVLNLLSAAVFVALVAVQVHYWPLNEDSLIPNLLLLTATPFLAFVPSGFLTMRLRHREAARWAAAHGFDHARRPDRPLPAHEVLAPQTGRARRPRMRDAVRGRVGHYPAHAFQYRWFTAACTPQHRTVLALELPAVYPSVTIGSAVRTPPVVTVPVSDEFDEKWWASAPDRQVLDELLPPARIAALLDLQLPTTAETRIVLTGNRLYAIGFGGNRGRELNRLFNALRCIADGLPAGAAAAAPGGSAPGSSGPDRGARRPAAPAATRSR